MKLFYKYENTEIKIEFYDKKNSFLKSIKIKNISPLAYRYFLLQTHYRKQLNFSWEALEASQNGLNNLRKTIKNKRRKRN